MKLDIYRNIGIALLVITGHVAITPAETQVSAHKEAAQTSVERQSGQVLDNQILEMVLSDLLKNPDFLQTTGFRDIVLSVETPGQPLNSDLFLSSSAKPAPAIPTDVRTNLQKRNSEVVPVPSYRHEYTLVRHRWTNYHPSNERILVRDISPFRRDVRGWSKFRNAYPDARGYVIAWLPGYSKDKKTALLHFLVGPSAHGAVGTYLLTSDGKKWAIKWRSIQHFL
jgi:hypothetical protein